ncbi:HD family phosphohydrolase [Vibrio genomosp. F10 str. ZF-129]|uniref:HD family phosphohydrolase n=1 Tax=Vibrio genomosp. F10 str. ZF-129 TaxID=1187848 RepID=A0A1E5BH61_9VIBR|nr:HD-GYP domain-containing protein [Vibrio genomosp. F10]OEE36025.1 HD family phosphohydrolase [Vibrio genomosp. F10 str. ZF-129]
MQYKIQDSIKISIDTLTVGMFVTAIEHTECVNLAHAGRVSSQSAIDQLKKSEVKFVWVDSKLSEKNCIFKPVKPEAESTEEAAPTPKPAAISSNAHKTAKKPTSRHANQQKAKKLIAEAKGLANRLMSHTFEGKIIELDEIDDWADNMIESVLIDSDALRCVSALRKKDAYLLEHSVNVACLLVTFGKHLGLDKNTLKQMAVGGIIHDIGKTKVKDEVLHKPAKLTPEEFEHMKLHQVFADKMIVHIEGLSDISRDVCLMHHEKLDGNGYPHGLKGDEIPLHARMVCIIDIYDALTADRCYKKGMSSSEAFKIILKLTPFHLDPDLVYKFINCIGVYPVGSLVELSDGRVGIVWTSNPTQPLKPEVKCFYSNKYNRFCDVGFIDLKSSKLVIEKAISPSSLDVDTAPFYD